MSRNAQGLNAAQAASATGVLANRPVSAEPGAAHVLEASAGGALKVPFGAFLLTAEFAREGGDLVLTGPGGSPVVVIHDYFSVEPPPDLITENGAQVDASLAMRLAGTQAPGQYAAAGDSPMDQPIGRVAEIDGEATATRVDGTKVTLTKDSPVFQGDIIETEDGAALKVVFVDQSTFSVGEGARMVLDELVFDPTTLKGESTISVLQGVFVFVSGEIAANNPEQMTVKTPVATIGIRGTAVAISAAQEGEQNKVVLLSEQTADGQTTTGAVVISNDAGTVVLDQAFEATVVDSFDSAPGASYVAQPSEIRSIVTHLGQHMPDAVQHLSAPTSSQSQADGPSTQNTGDAEDPGNGGPGADDGGPRDDGGQDSQAAADGADGEPNEGAPADMDLAAFSDAAAGFEGDVAMADAPPPEGFGAPEDGSMFAEDAAYFGDTDFSQMDGMFEGASVFAADQDGLFMEDSVVFGEAPFSFDGSIVFTDAPGPTPGEPSGALGAEAPDDGVPSGTLAGATFGAPAEGDQGGTFGPDAFAGFDGLGGGFGLSGDPFGGDVFAGDLFAGDVLSGGFGADNFDDPGAFDDTFGAGFGGFSDPISAYDALGFFEPPPPPPSDFNPSDDIFVPPDEPPPESGPVTTGSRIVFQGSDLFLGGNILELGVSQSGSLGSAGPAPETFHPLHSSGAIALTADVDGVEAGLDATTGDFFLPGTPEEGFSLGFATPAAPSAPTVFSNFEAAGATDIATTTSGFDFGGVVIARTEGVVGGEVGFRQDIVLGENDTFFQTNVTLHNLGSSPVLDLRYMRAANADPEADTSFATNNTFNDVLANPEGASRDVAVTSRGANTGVSLTYYTEALPEFLIDARASSPSTGAFRNPYAAAAFDTPVDPNAAGDREISLTFTLGSLLPSEGVSFSFVTTLNIETAFNDFLVGTTGADTLNGLAGNDILRGLAGNDVLLGGDGFDVLVGGIGQDKMFGGADADQLVSGVGIDLLDGGDGDDLYDFVGEPGITFIVDASGADVLTALPDFIDVTAINPASARAELDAAGNLIITSDRPGVDGFAIIIDNQAGAHTIETFSFFGSGVGAFTFTSSATAGNDAVVLGAGATSFNGLGGNDAIYASGLATGVTLVGGAGRDFLVGGAGNDALDGGTEADALVGGGGIDLLNGGAGDDLLDGETMSGALGDDILVIGHEVESGIVVADGGGDLDFVSIEGGLDRAVSFQFISGGLEASFRQGNGQLLTVQLFDVEAIARSTGLGTVELLGLPGGVGVDGDVVVGTGSGELLVGGVGNDLVFGNGGDDTLDGSDGDDLLSGGGGNDAIDGGFGFDVIDFGNATSGVGVVADLGAGVATSGDPEIGVDTFTSIEGVRGTAFADLLTGDASDNILDGGGGDDILAGGLGIDRYVWSGFDGSTNTTINESDGTNILRIGLPGDATRLIDFSYTKVGSDLVISHLLGDPINERLTISGHFSGNSVGIFETDDLLAGRFGPQVAPILVTGGSASGGAAADFMITVSTGGANLTGGAGDDVLIGNNGADILNGGAGDDVIAGGVGNDSMVGGTGDDVFLYVPDFASSTSIQDVDGTERIEFAKLAAFTVRNNDADLIFSFQDGGTLTLVDHMLSKPIELLGFTGRDDVLLLANGRIGTIGNDLIAGNATAETLSGDDGNDLIYGHTGNDLLIGGFGSDILVGGAGVDIMTGNGGALEADVFRYYTPGDGATAANGVSGLQSGDQITDFDSLDRFEFHFGGFGYGSRGDTVATDGVDFFTVSGFDGTNASASGNGSSYFVFDPTTRTLYHDDGSAGTGYTVIATVQAGATVSANDVRVSAFEGTGALA